MLHHVSGPCNDGSACGQIFKGPGVGPFGTFCCSKGLEWSQETQLVTKKFKKQQFCNESCSEFLCHEN